MQQSTTNIPSQSELLSAYQRDRSTITTLQTDLKEILTQIAPQATLAFNDEINLSAALFHDALHIFSPSRCSLGEEMLFIQPIQLKKQYPTIPASRQEAYVEQVGILRETIATLEHEANKGAHYSPLHNQDLSTLNQNGPTERTTTIVLQKDDLSTTPITPGVDLEVKSSITQSDSTISSPNEHNSPSHQEITTPPTISITSITPRITTPSQPSIYTRIGLSALTHIPTYCQMKFQQYHTTLSQQQQNTDPVLSIPHDTPFISKLWQYFKFYIFYKIPYNILMWKQWFEVNLFNYHFLIYGIYITLAHRIMKITYQRLSTSPYINQPMTIDKIVFKSIGSILFYSSLLKILYYLCVNPRTGIRYAFYIAKVKLAMFKILILKLFYSDSELKQRYCNGRSNIDGIRAEDYLSLPVNHTNTIDNLDAELIDTNTVSLSFFSPANSVSPIHDTHTPQLPIHAQISLDKNTNHTNFVINTELLPINPRAILPPGTSPSITTTPPPMRYYTQLTPHQRAKIRKTLFRYDVSLLNHCRTRNEIARVGLDEFDYNESSYNAKVNKNTEKKTSVDNTVALCAYSMDISSNTDGWSTDFDEYDVDGDTCFDENQREKSSVGDKSFVVYDEIEHFITVARQNKRLFHHLIPPHPPISTLLEDDDDDGILFLQNHSQNYFMSKNNPLNHSSSTNVTTNVTPNGITDTDDDDDDDDIPTSLQNNSTFDFSKHDHIPTDQLATVIRNLSSNIDPLKKNGTILDHNTTNNTRLVQSQSIQPTLLKTKCAICFGKAKATTATLCGHLYCWECILPFIEAKKECPTCRTHCLPSQLLRLFQFQ